MTIIQTECVLVSSVLCGGAGKPGPATCTALAYAPDYWESVEAGKLAQAIGKVLSRGMHPSLPMVKAVTGAKYRPWLEHPNFSERHALPLGLVEVEARELVPHYQGKRLTQLVGKCYEKMMDHPEHARHLAHLLKLQLEQWT